MTCARWSLTAESLSRLWRVVWGTPAQDWSSREARVYSSDTCLPARTRTPETDTASALIKLDWGVKPHIIYQVALKLWCFLADGSIATDHYFSSSVLLDFNNKSEYVSGSAPSSLSCLFSPAAGFAVVLRLLRVCWTSPLRRGSSGAVLQERGV